MLEHPVLVAGGLISYSVFLWHEPIVRYLHDHEFVAAGAGGLVLNIALVVTVTAVLSALTYRFVEATALRWKARRA